MTGSKRPWRSRLGAGARRARRFLEQLRGRNGPASASYASLYERQGRDMPPTSSIGAGDFDLIGRIELGLLQMEGLRPTDTVVDFGCGTGRLAVHLIPRIAGGHYIGIDIAQSMLDRAQRLVTGRLRDPKATITWKRQLDARFALPDGTVDILCAFSVFTHMEHEDSYRYLADARRVVRPGGKLLFSCLPLGLAEGRRIFLESAERDLRDRWREVRNVVTSVEMMTAIATLAGWEVARWYDGSEENVVVPGETAKWALGQSTCVLVRPRT